MQEVAVLDVPFYWFHADRIQNVTKVSKQYPLSNPFTLKKAGPLTGDHETKVAGTLCAEGDNFFGMAGVAWNALKDSLNNAH